MRHGHNWHLLRADFLMHGLARIMRRILTCLGLTGFGCAGGLRIWRFGECRWERRLCCGRCWLAFVVPCAILLRL